jgi:DNA repair and recombination RAD54-like protein
VSACAVVSFSADGTTFFADSQTFQALNALNVQRRVILSGTPIQNDLSEYFSLLNFANPEYLGTRLDFRKNFELKILRGRDSDATEKERQESDAKLKELGGQVSKFIIRRTNDLLSKYRTYPSALWKIHHFMFSISFQSPSNTSTSFSAISVPFRLPSIAYSSHRRKSKSCCAVSDLSHSKPSTSCRSFATTRVCSICQTICLDAKRSCRKTLRMAREVQAVMWIARCQASLWFWKGEPVSGKGTARASSDIFTSRMLDYLNKNTNDKIVLISNYTQTLDLFERLCRNKK